MDRKTIGIVLGIVIAVVLGGAIWMQSETEEARVEKTHVVASFYPLAHFTAEIARDKVDVINITPAGVEPHEYEPTAKQIADVYSAKLLIANGSGIDPWAERIKGEIESKGARVLVMSEHLDLLEGTHEEHKGEDTHEDEEEEHESGHDPHFWLDPTLAARQVLLIRDALISVDPANETEYRRNADTYAAKLVALDQAYRDGMAQCASRDLVTSHAAFAYLAARYQLQQIAIAGLSPEDEPSAGRLAEIATLARERNIKYIFFETLVSPKLAETLAREVGAQTMVLNTLEGLIEEEIKEGKDYISIMKENLVNLRTALQCK